MKKIIKFPVLFAFALSVAMVSPVDASASSSVKSYFSKSNAAGLVLKKQATSCTVEARVGLGGFFGARVTATAGTCKEAWQMIRDMRGKRA